MTDLAALGLPQPYPQDSNNFIYNLLFCDVPSLFQSAESGPWVALSSPQPDLDALQLLANDPKMESRMRAVAFNRLRDAGRAVPAKLLLGVIFEVPQPKGLDTLAAYADGRVRYINQSGKLSVFEQMPPVVVEKCVFVLKCAQPLVNAIGPWTKPRLPPSPDQVRMTFLVSDGLYFGQAPYKTLANDKVGGPVLRAGVALLFAVTDAVARKPK